MTQTPIFSESEWSDIRVRVTTEMVDFLRPYRTGVYQDFGDHGKGWGSGSYLRAGSQRGILTNSHVAAGRTPDHHLIHMFKDTDTLHPLTDGNVRVDLPIDLAFMPVTDDIWDQQAHGSRTIKRHQISTQHAPVTTELLALTGFPGERSKFLFDTMFAEATCLVAREVELPTDDERFDPTYHFGIDYRPDLATNVAGGNGLALPPGLSGSTVWNTGFIEASVAGATWTPEWARVTGVVWGWPSNAACLVATRAEYLHEFLDIVEKQQP